LLERLAGLEFFKVIFKLLPIPQTLRANTTQWQVLGSAQLIVFAVTACKIFATASAALKKNHFSVKDARDCVHEVLDVVAAFDGVEALLAIIVQPRVYQKHELFFFNPRKLKRFLIQNYHFCSEPVHFN
jgi:hypothetical protein